jgi:hypothetical protein
MPGSDHDDVITPQAIAHGRRIYGANVAVSRFHVKHHLRRAG